MPDFGSDDIRDALGDAPDASVDDDAVIGRDDPEPVPARRPAETRDTDSETTSDDDETTSDATAPGRRDRDDETLKEILADIRAADDSEPRPPELRDTDTDTPISTTTVAAAVIGLAAAGLAAYLGVLPA